jgi:hypothetical protein
MDIGWREISSEAWGLPNPKHHSIVVATEQQGTMVDSCLFSTVRQAYCKICLSCVSQHFTGTLTEISMLLLSETLTNGTLDMCVWLRVVDCSTVVYTSHIELPRQ